MSDLVCVVGYGLIDGIGANHDECFLNLQNDNNFHKSCENVLNYNPLPLRKKIDCLDLRGIYPNYEKIVLPNEINSIHYPRHVLYALHSVDQALKHSHLPLLNDVAVLFSSATRGNEYLVEHMFTKTLSPKKSYYSVLSSLSSVISAQYGFGGLTASVDSACATGLVTLDYGMRLVNDYDYVVVGGSDAGLNWLDIVFAHTAGALSKTNKSRPFDINRDGFVMGEGSGCLILQSMKKAQKYQSKIYALLNPVYSSSDAEHLVDPRGEGSRKIYAKIAKHHSNIEVINAHATSTIIGDQTEHDEAIKFFPNSVLYSVKGKIGHTYGAAGVIETIYGIMCMNNDIIPKNHNVVHTHLSNVNVTQIQKKYDKFLKNSFGFGGRCSSLVVEKYK